MLSSKASSLVCCLLMMRIMMLRAQVQSASPSQLRKQQYLDTVIENYYQKPRRITIPCLCAESTSSTPDVSTEDSGTPTSCDYIAPPAVNITYLNNRDPTIPVWPFMGLPLPNGTLEDAICRIGCELSSTGDMDLSQLVRALYFTNTSADRNQIIQQLQTLFDGGNLPIWIQPNDRHRIAWSENHMIMHMASDHLLRPVLDYSTYNYTGLETLPQRLEHWLDIKIQYGFYEFYSTTYLRFTLGAVLNLVDFSPDPVIRSKATEVADRLISEWLLATTSAGYIFPVAGRNYEPTYHSVIYFYAIQWMTLGTGKQLDNVTWASDYLAAFLATSTYDLEKHVANWSPQVDTTLTTGHDASYFKTLHASLNRVDRAVFQWSAGGFTLPETVDDTRYLVKLYNLENHESWKEYKQVFDLPLSSLRKLSLNLQGQSRGTDISGARITLYKNYNVVLSSLPNFLTGARSGEQWPWVAAVHDVVVYTQSGVTGNCVTQSVGENGLSNTHLPQVKQMQNVALISYRPSHDVIAPSMAFQQLSKGMQFPTQVALKFPVQLFDEVTQIGQWILGRRLDSYIAVYRDDLNQHVCTPPANGGGTPFLCDPYYYSNPQGTIRGQVWVAVVGNDGTHGSFEQFQKVIAAAKVKKFTLFLPFQGVQWRTFKTSVRVDGKRLLSSLRGMVQRPLQ